MTIHFQASTELHPYTVELVEQAMQECGSRATLPEVVAYCEWAVKHDNGNHLHRNDGESTICTPSHETDTTFDPNNSTCNGY